MVDNSSKFFKLYALEDRTAITATRFVYDYCLVYGIPEKTYSDQDLAFQETLFTQLMKQSGINKSRTTSFIKVCQFFWSGIGQTVERTSLCLQFICSYINRLYTL